MRIPTGRFGPLVLTLSLVALGSACQGGEEADEATPADTTVTAVEPAPSDEGGVSGGLAPSSSPVEAVVTNTMPHAMVVLVQLEGGAEIDLGVVPASSEQTFRLPTSAGETVTLVARDEANTHSRETTRELAAGQTETWTIE